MEIWRGQLGGPEINPYVELAKQYEHRLRDYAKAANVIQEALDRSKARAFGLHLSRDTVTDLEHRLARIEQKAGRADRTTHTTAVAALTSPQNENQ